MTFNMSKTPRGGWLYLERATKTWFTADGYDELIKKVTEHRKYKGLDVESTEIDVQKQFCMRLGDKQCKDFDEHYPDMTDLAPEDKMISFSKAVISFLRSGAELVSKEESERRAEICQSCPFNRATGCSCSTLHAIVDSLVPKSRREKGIAVCTVCGCSLKAKILLPKQVVDESNSVKQFPSWCWQRVDS